MKTRWPGFAAAMSLMLSLFGPACGVSPVRLAWLANDAKNTYDNAILTGIMDAAGPSQSTVEPFFAGFDPEQQAAQCKQALDAHLYDGMLIIAADPIKILPCVMKAESAGVPVAAVDLPIGSDQTTVAPQVRGEVAASFITASDFANAVGTLLPQVCAGLQTCNLFYIAGLSSFPAEVCSLNMIKQAAAANAAIRLVGDGEALYDTGTARKVASDALAAHPEINAMIALGDQMALGVEQAATAAGVKLRIVGGGAGASALSAVREGRWLATLNALPRTEGRLGAELLIKAIRDRNTPPMGVNPVASSGLPLWWTKTELVQHPDFVAEWPGP